MLSRLLDQQTAFGATDVFIAAVWVLRALGIIATVFVAMVVASWLI
jgi:hypothetical protein